MGTARFKNRTEAGQRLAVDLQEFKGQKDVVVLGLPRGGVVVAAEVARALKAPLDVFVVRKLGVPGDEELAMGAIASGGIRVENPDVISSLNIPEEVVNEAADREHQALVGAEKLYRGDRPPLALHGKTVILVDDGLATGASMRAAVTAVRTREPKQIVIAVPTAAQEASASFVEEVDEVICTIRPHQFMGVGAWYDDFSQVSDDTVRSLLDRAANPPKTA